MKYPALQKFLKFYIHKPAIKKISNSLQISIKQGDVSETISLYRETVPLIEDEIFSSDFDDSLIDLFHKVFQELEALLFLTNDDRYDFIIVIPVADRPLHLKNCLESILKLCKLYGYGGFENGCYRKVSVVIADDTHDSENILKNKEIVRHYNSLGIDTIYFGITDQLQQIDQLSDDTKESLVKILGKIDRSNFSHKGASRMRNIAYLKLNQMIDKDKKQLFYFIDSDQEFRVKVEAQGDSRDLYIKNYFYDLNEIFSSTDAEVLTGKVVGDPPVSPAVMAGNFIDDVIAFLNRLASVESGCACGFHNSQEQIADDASYHDMADLFGFEVKKDAYQYKCPLNGNHSNLDCLNEFSNELNRFFYGEHPTRKTCYEHETAMISVKAARTIYTGNYIFKPDGLKYFIPFAALKLRMAGPVLGRIVKSEINEKFISVNLPMLHKRTVDDSGQSEFRSGVSDERDLIDLSDEFERQYFGDVMLFSMEKLTEMGYPSKVPSEAVIDKVLLETESEMHAVYQHKHVQIIKKITLLKAVFEKNTNWWNQLDGLDSEKKYFETFINNIEHNFSDKSRGYELINSETHKKNRHEEILLAIRSYSSDRAAWKKTLSVIH
jgi:hypothetical protein